jgi:glycosyltransferase involved in cell wall biosynthesis
MSVQRSISVIIPTIRGREEFLLQAIESVIGQTMRPLEILIVGNTKLKFYSTLSVKYFVQSNLNASQARNLGLSKARGKLIAFLDDDDIWDQNFLAESNKYLHERNLDVVFGQIWLFKGDQLSSSVRIKFGESFEGIYHSNPGIVGSNILARKHCLEVVQGFRENLSVSQDKALAIDLTQAGFRLGFSPGKCFLREHSLPRLTNYYSQLLGTIEFTKVYWHQMPFISKILNLQRINSLHYDVNRQKYRLGLKALFKFILFVFKSFNKPLYRTQK